MLSCGTSSVLLINFRLHFAKCLSKVVVLIVDCGGPKMENGFGSQQWASDVQSAAAGRGNSSQTKARTKRFVYTLKTVN